MGNSNQEVSDDDNAQAMASFSEARRLSSQKNYDAAVVKFTEAIVHNPRKAVFFANRAECFLKLQKPNAAIKDCDLALKLNPDQSKAYKVRGAAKRHLGQYEAAILDLFTGNKLDFDEDTDKIARGIKERVDKLVAKRRERERHAEQAERKRKLAERQRAAEEARRRAEASVEEEDMPGMGGAPGMGGLPPEFQQILSDPEVQAALRDPETSQKLMETMSNPASALKYASDPKIASLLKKLAPLYSKMGTPTAPGGQHGQHHGHSHAPGQPCNDHFDVDDLD
eukprot:TRINITY_DN799_c0_g1_i2.p1 TRINITY_DN799_c0_g1~~TRINITY_DN799_c0_g1_i2.p1  ORF type:complete len:282 (-),score=52.31 TRINITY_DN799_c0_g1_i2:45-890(-)